MSVSELAIVLQSSVGLILLAIVLRLWGVWRLDVFRQQMFSVRDALFDYAAQGNISFSHPAYRLLRKQMNGVIRYGHRLTFYQLAMTIAGWNIMSNQPRIRWATAWENALNSIPDRNVQAKLAAFHTRALYLVAKKLVFGSPLLLTMLFCFVAKTTLQKGWSNLRKVINAAISDILPRIVDPRYIEEEASRLGA